jgi:hypothetical protein
MSQEEVRRHGNADGDDEAADDLRVEFLGVMGPALSAQDGAQEHHQGLWPQHYACRDERNHGSAIDHGIEERVAQRGGAASKPKISWVSN